MGWSIHIGEDEGVNYTHNTNRMIREAGIPDWPYNFLDHIQDDGCAGDMIEPLCKAICNMLKDPEKYKEMNPANGWGNYKSLLTVLMELVVLCAENPSASVRHWS